MVVPSEAGPSKVGRDGTSEEKDDRVFECNICLDTPKEAVVSMCGHLFWYVLILYFPIFVF